MQNDKEHPEEYDKKFAAVCGLFCEACNLYIATQEDPARLTRLAARFQVSEEDAQCYGCRSDKRGPYCRICKMFSCAAERGIDFCSECEDYPCNDLKQFQAERPHRIELFDDLERIKGMGYESWLHTIRAHYTCPQCGTMNSAYDFKCRKCGREPSCDYVAMHKPAIEQSLKNT